SGAVCDRGHRHYRYRDRAEGNYGRRCRAYHSGRETLARGDPAFRLLAHILDGEGQHDDAGRTVGERGTSRACACSALLGPPRRAVAYLASTENVSSSLSTRLRRANQPVISTRPVFSTPRPSLL